MFQIIASSHFLWTYGDMTVFCILWLIKMKMLLIIYFVKWLAEEWLLASFLGKAMVEELTICNPNKT